MNEVRDISRCTKCGGKCCKIYLSEWEGGTKSEQVWFDEWVEAWDEAFANSGADKIEPLFDPLYVHITGNEYLKELLLMQGLDPDKCKYCGTSGCILPWEVRPKVCKEFICMKWRKELEHDT